MSSQNVICSSQSTLPNLTKRLSKSLKGKHQLEPEATHFVILLKFIPTFNCIPISNEFFNTPSTLSPTESVDDIQTIEPVFVHHGDEYCSPIPGDSPNITNPHFIESKACDKTKEEGDEAYDQTFNVQRMLKRESYVGSYTHLYIPFPSSSPMKGVHICLSGFSDISHLIFTFTSSKGEKTSKKYKFPQFYGNHWYFLPVDLSDVVLCEITGKAREEGTFSIQSLIFIREETSEETIIRETKEKIWSEAPVVLPKFVKVADTETRGIACVPISYDDPSIINPLFSMVEGKDV
ncbi:hypothetical protein ADUPG1_001258, partial [Aduncisulcus paluster]